jgi:hypothetical protein
MMTTREMKKKIQSFKVELLAVSMALSILMMAKIKSLH